MKSVLVLGADGMLGHVVSRFLKQSQCTVLETSRNSSKNSYIKFDALNDELDILTKFDFEYIVNCIGVIKPNINENDSSSVLNAIFVNSVFPRKLVNFFPEKKIIQIATDCVFDGLKGNYLESDYHNPIDIYGKTKSLGELNTDNNMIIRTSIIGRELKSNLSFWEWIKGLNDGEEVKGFTNHFWNGITTLAFAKIVLSIMQNNFFEKGTFHILPSDVVNKYQLVDFVASAELKKLKLKKFSAAVPVNRILLTNKIKKNNDIWLMSQYNCVPKIKDLVSEFVLWYKNTN